GHHRGVDQPALTFSKRGAELGDHVARGVVQEDRSAGESLVAALQIGAGDGPVDTEGPQVVLRDSYELRANHHLPGRDVDQADELFEFADRIVVAADDDRVINVVADQVLDPLRDQVGGLAATGAAATAAKT